MATFIRIKRRLCDEPLDSILVRPKRRRVDGGGAESGGGGGGGVEEAASPPLPPPTLLERVGTVESKDARIAASLLKEYKKGWELKQSYKRLGGGGEGGGGEGWKVAGRRMAKERERESREMITNRHRGDITDTTTTTTSEKEENNKKRKKTQNTEEEEEEEDEKKKKEEEEEEEEEEEVEVQFYDAPLIRNVGSDVITCNGQPMESEKCVYDIYYFPQDTDWTEFVFEQPKAMEVKEEEEEEEDDENDEDNWRNDYPEEEEEEEEEDEDDYVEEYDYFERPSRRRNILGDSDESFDAEAYDSEEDECGFDDDGNLITVASLGERLMMTTLKGGEESE